MFRHHFATFGNTIEMCKISAFERNLSTIFLKIFNIYSNFEYISKSQNSNFAIKYLAIFDENVARIFQLQ